jgi:hypothetical protein
MEIRKLIHNFNEPTGCDGAEIVPQETVETIKLILKHTYRKE